MDDDRKKAAILLCRCEQAKVVSAETVAAIREHLTQAGTAFHETADLCGPAARRSEALSALAAAGDVLIAACFPRAVRWLFVAAGAPLPADRTRIINMRNGHDDRASADVAAWLEKRGHSAFFGAEKGDILLFSPPEETGGRQPAATGQAEGRNVTNYSKEISVCKTDGKSRMSPFSSEWKSWFPVVDYERCTGCMQCLSFCLFGVYDRGSDEEGSRVIVDRPANCKTNCPACARVCPAGAIIFPKYADAPINGAEVSPGEDGSAAAEGPAAALGPDIYAALRRRSARQAGSRQRFAPAGPADHTTAEAERAQFKDLAAVAQQLDVPEELTRSLFPIASTSSGCNCDCECECTDDGDCDCDCDCPCAPDDRE